MIRPHVGPRLTQGSIFTCAQAEDYEGCEVYGLVITARCDIAHGKTKAFNYLPVVKFDDFLHRDFLILFCDQCKADEDQRFITFLERNNISRSVLIAHSPQHVIDTFFPERATERAVIKARPIAQEHVRRLTLLEKAWNSTPSELVVRKVAAEYPKLRDQLIKNLYPSENYGLLLSSCD